MQPGFLLSDEDKKKEEEKLKKIELREKLRRKIAQKQNRRNGRPSKYALKKLQEEKDKEWQKYLTGDHSSQNIYNHVLYLMSDLEKHKNEKDRLKIAKKYENKHTFLHQNYFNIYREVCYGRLKDLGLLRKMLKQRDLQFSQKKSEEEATQEVGKMLTEKFISKKQMKKFEKMSKEELNKVKVEEI